MNGLGKKSIEFAAMEAEQVCNSGSGLLTWEQAVAWARGNPDMRELVEVCYYDDPIEVAASRFRRSEEWRAIKSFFPPGMGRRVIEIGAGRGILSWAFASDGCDVYAHEPDPSDLVGSGAIRRLCARTGLSITVVESAAETLAYPENYFDCAVCRGVLHHVRDLEQVCREVHRVLRPRGRFLAIKEHIADTPEELEAFLQIHPLHHLYGGENAFALARYKSALAGAGFVGIRSFGHYDHVITSAPAITTGTLREMMQTALARRIPRSLARWLASSDFGLYAYRRWLTYRTRIPGRLYSFIADKRA